MAFVPLFCQSHHSPLGVASPAELVERGRAVGYGTLGLCDEATMGGFQEFDEACREHAIRPIFGVRLAFPGFVAADRSFPLDFLIESEQGYRNLVRILAQYHELKDQEEGLRRKLPLKGRTAGLRVVIPPDGELAALMLQRDRKAIELFLQIAGDAFAPTMGIGVSGEPERAEAEAMARKLAAFVKQPALAAPRVYMASPAEAPAHVYLSHPEGAPDRTWKMPERPEELPALFSEEVMAGRFPEGDDAAHESGEIARRCLWRPGLIRRIMPTQDFERGFDSNSFLFDLVIRGAGERYGAINEELKQRINREFEEVKARNLASHLLLFREIANFLDKEGISRGVGRGSVVTSVMAYCLGITRFDPIQYRLAFQPLAREGETFPPLRIEIPSNALEKLIEQLKKTYGEAHLAQIGRRAELKREQAIELLAAWAGMNEEERKMALRERARPKASLPAARLKEKSEQKQWRRWRDPVFLAEAAHLLAGRPRALQPAPGKWTLSAEPLEYVIPTIATAEGPRATEIGEAALDRLGAPRIEFAPHHLLNLLDRARQAVNQAQGGANMQIPLEDRATFELLARGDTIGIPPLEGITMKALLRREKPGNVLQILRVKTEAGRGRASEKPAELIDELPDVLLSYQCAWFKAHYPEAFFAAALSSASEAGEDVSVLARAAATAGIELVRPDINLSSGLCTVHGGKIRLGLLMVRQFGEKSWEEILAVRRGGGFESLTDFCQRVSPRVMNQRVLQNLIAAGAFDGFGETRADMSERVGRLARRSRASEREGEPEDVEGQITLFNLEDEPEDIREAAGAPAGSTGAEWDEPARRRREREALGFALSSGAMDSFPLAMASLQPLAPGEIGPRHAGKIVRTAGLIDHIDDEGPLAEIEGARLIDLEGLPVWLSPAIAAVARRSAAGSVEALVIGEATVKGGYTRLDAHGVWRMADIEDQASRVARIRLNLAGENSTTLRHLITLARQFKGASRLELAGYEHARGLSYRFLERRRVFFCSPFYQGLCKILPVERIELFDPSDRPLSIALSSEEPGAAGPG